MKIFFSKKSIFVISIKNQIQGVVDHFRDALHHGKKK